MTKVIVKVQRPLNNPDADYLVYAEGRENAQTIPLGQFPRHVREIFTSSQAEKRYFYAKLIDGKWKIDKLAPWQPW